MRRRHRDGQDHGITYGGAKVKTVPHLRRHFGYDDRRSEGAYCCVGLEAGGSHQGGCAGTVESWTFLTRYSSMVFY